MEKCIQLAGISTLDGVFLILVFGARGVKGETRLFRYTSVFNSNN
jgi:hypothetical protein